MAQYELNLREYWQIVQKRRWAMLTIFSAVLIFCVIYTHLQRPLYQASASVQWIERKTLGGMLTELVTVRSGDPLTTQSKIITSLPVLEKVVLDLGIAGEQASPTEILACANDLRSLVSTEIVADTNIIRIIVIDKNPQMAAGIANKIAEIYIIENLKEKTKQSRNVREFIEKQLVEISGKLKKSEERLMRFKELAAPSGIAEPLQTNLADLQAQRQELLQKFTLAHPDIKNLDEQIRQTEGELRKLPKKELEYIRLNREAEINGKLYRELKDKLESARIAEAEKIEDVSLVNRAMSPDSPVSPNKPLNYLLGIVIGIMLGLSGIFVIEQLDTSIGTIEDVEGYLKLPALGVIPYLRTMDEKTGSFIHRLLHKDIKTKGAARLRDQLLVHYSNTSPICEAYRILRTNIQNEVFKGKIQGKVILLTSSGPEEGKSITVSNLAIVMAQVGLRTLLIDADMRRSTIHKIFGLKKREPGLCDCLRETVKVEEALRTFTDVLMGDLGFDNTLKIPGIDNLNILPSGSLPIQPAELLASGEMSSLLEKLKNKFDLILIDSPPVLAVADAVIIASHTDGVILVYKVGKTARSILSRTKMQLQESGAQVKGIILNNISPDIELRYGYYYHYKYYGKYYTSDEKEKQNT